MENGSREWFEAHRGEYVEEVLGPLKAFIGELGQFLGSLSPELETEPRVGRTLSRISNGARYRGFILAGFPRRGKKLASEASLHVGIYSHGIAVGFHPGDSKGVIGPAQEQISRNQRLFQRYLDERRIAERYWELAGGEDGQLTRWPLPKTARRWARIENLTVGEYFPASDPLLGQRSFLARAREILFDLYPLWVFAVSEDPRRDLELYFQRARLSMGRGRLAAGRIPLSDPTYK